MLPTEAALMELAVVEDRVMVLEGEVVVEIIQL